MTDQLKELLDYKIIKTPYQDINFSNINWLDNPYDHTSWIFIVHKMDYLFELSEYYSSTKNTKALDLIFFILSSWYESCRNQLDNPWAFHDHATALRTSNLAKIYQAMHGKIEGERLLFIYEILELNIQKLNQDTFYSFHTNHGLDQSLALYEASFCLKDLVLANTLKEKAIARINDEISFVFCSDGGHKENTPTYLNYGISQVQRALLLGMQKEGKNSKIYFPLEILKKAFLNLGFFTQPNGFCPLIGDSTTFSPRDFVSKELGIYQSREYQNYLYLISLGKYGVKPDITNLFLEESGYVIIRGSLEKEKFDKRLHLVFKCGHLSNYHRHDDDLHFTLFFDNEEWLSDGGLYEYSERNAYRKLFRSHKSHNLSFPSFVNAHRDVGKSKYSKITHFKESDGFVECQATSYMFEGFENKRTLLYDIKKQVLCIQDHCKPINLNTQVRISQCIETKEKTYTTSFLIPANKQVQLNENKQEIKIIGKNKTLCIKVKNSNGGGGIKTCQRENKQSSFGIYFEENWSKGTCILS